MDQPQRLVWIVSDTHFCHSRLCQYTGRPDDFTEQIIANWQRLVGWNDTVIHLGDVQLGRESQFKSIQDQLPGNKILIEGNHDHHSPRWYMDRGFLAVFSSITMGLDGRILLSHAPALPLPANVDHNIHGHFHNADNRRLIAEHTQKEIDYYHAVPGRYALVEIESNLSPVLLSDFCEAHNIKL